MSEHRLPERDRPWVMRTYAGHSDARRSNELYRRNLAKGQTGLSVAFDLPTQTGYDPDHVLARGEVGKVGVSVAHKGDMHQLLDGIPLDEMNTSMTINATAAWLLGLYVTVAEENGVDRSKLKGTTQNDIIKEYLSRGTYAFPPEPSMRLIADMVAFTVNEVPSWNPTNICSYHLQEAGATPVQEIAYALSTGIAVLDEVKARGQVADADFPKVFGRISFFVNAGIRLIEEIAKLRAMGRLWNEIGRERYGVTDEKMLRFRYGVQVNSLGLTEAQPENNIQRIVLEALAVTLSRDARARAIQLPAWNEAMGLPRPWDQQWSLRIQQVLANETDLLEYPDLFEGSVVMDGLVEELIAGARAEMAVVEEHGGAVAAVPYMKARLVESHRERVARIESGEQKVIGQNSFTETEDSPLTAGADGGILTPDPEVERERVEALESWKAERNDDAVRAALDELARIAADDDQNVMPATIAAAKAGATTGEWAEVLRESFGAYRGPTGVSGAAPAADREQLEAIRAKVEEVSAQLGHRIKILVGKPGLDGHSNGSEQIALRARDAGMEVIYQGIRLTPEEIAESALQEDVDVVGLSILSGSHLELVPEVVRILRANDVDVPVVVGGIIPVADAERLRAAGVDGVYTPKDFDINKIMGEIVDLVAGRAGAPAAA
ncbi:MAG TPA: methylmalonyl-CoA mutase family protein [Solirubrobacterales bacterium]|nr:methylmalonyl-CoA mutase family protein [Solirubrobacterales bacterium]